MSTIFLTTYAQVLFTCQLDLLFLIVDDIEVCLGVDVHVYRLCEGGKTAFPRFLGLVSIFKVGNGLAKRV